jgi:hypothetical protein
MTKLTKNEALDLFFALMEDSARIVHNIRALKVTEKINNAAHLFVCNFIATAANQINSEAPFINNFPNQIDKIDMKFPGMIQSNQFLCKLEVLEQWYEFLRLFTESVASLRNEISDLLLQIDSSGFICNKNEEFEAVFVRSDKKEKKQRYTHAMKFSLLSHRKSLLYTVQSYSMQHLTLDLSTELLSLFVGNDNTLTRTIEIIQKKIVECDLQSRTIYDLIDASLKKANKLFIRRYENWSTESLEDVLSHPIAGIKKQISSVVVSSGENFSTVQMPLTKSSNDDVYVKNKRTKIIDSTATNGQIIGKDPVEIKDNMPNLLQRQLASETLLNFFGKSKTFEVYRHQIFKFFNLPSGKVILIEPGYSNDFRNDKLLEKDTIPLEDKIVEQDHEWTWKVIDSLMSRIDMIIMYDMTATYDEKMLLEKFEESYCSHFFQVKTFDIWCNSNVLRSTMRQHLRSQLHSVSVQLFKELNIDNPFETLCHKIVGSPPSFKKSDDIDDNNTVLRNICKQVFIGSLGQNRRNADIAFLAQIMVRVKHLRSISGKLSFNVGLMVCVMMNAITTLSDCNVETFEFMMFTWKELLALPFVENGDTGQGLTSRNLTLNEKKCGLRLFAALTTFVPLPVNECFEIFKLVHISDPKRMNAFFAVQKQELKSLSMLFSSTKEAHKVSETLLLCSIASHCSVWKYWEAAHTSIYEFHNHRFVTIRVRITLVPTSWLELTVIILAKALKFNSFKGRMQAVRLTGLIIQILLEFYSQCDVSLRTIEKNPSNCSSEMESAVKHNKRRLCWGLREVRSKLGKYFEGSNMDPDIQKNWELVELICSTNQNLL